MFKGTLNHSAGANHKETLLQRGVEAVGAGLTAWEKPIAWQMGIPTFKEIICVFLRDRNHYRNLFNLQYPRRDHFKTR